MAKKPAPAADMDFEETEPELEPVEELDVGDELEQPPEDFIYDEDESNLVTAFLGNPEGKAWLAKFAVDCHDKFERTRDSTQEYRERIGRDMKIFSGDLPPKVWPYEDCANPHVPIMLENITRLTTRAAGELFGDWNNVFEVVPYGANGKEKADILTLHGNWQFREQIRDFDRQMDRALIAYFTWGDVTCKSYYDKTRRANRHETLTPDEFFVPYVFVTTQPDYSDVPFRFQLLHYYRHDIERMRDEWVDVEKVLSRDPPSWQDEPYNVIREAVGESQSVEVPDQDHTAPYRLIQYEGWEELPNQSESRFVQAIIDLTTKAVLSLAIHEEADWRDQLRYETQLQEAQQYQMASAQYDAAYQSSLDLEDRLRSTLGADPTIPGDAKLQMLQSVGQQVPLPNKPPRPSWMGEDESVPPLSARKVPIQMYVHGVCIENMTGSLGLSYGRIQADFNRAANVALSQFTDSATQGNVWSIITTDTVTFKSPFTMRPGSVNVAEGVSGAELKNNIMELKPEPANPQMLQVVDRMYQYGQSSMQSPNVLSGESGKSGETFRGLNARLEQASKQLTVPTRKFARGPLRQLFINNAKLNSIYLEDEEIVNVVDYRANELRTIKVGRDLYRRGYDVTISADMRFSSEAQKVSEADELVTLANTIPAMAGNIPFLQQAIKGSLEARKRYDLVPLLGPPAPPVMTPLGIPSPPPPGMAPTPGQPAPAPGGAPPSAQPGGPPKR